VDGDGAGCMGGHRALAHGDAPVARADPWLLLSVAAEAERVKHAPAAFRFAHHNRPVRPADETGVLRRCDAVLVPASAHSTTVARGVLGGGLQWPESARSVNVRVRPARNPSNCCSDAGHARASCKIALPSLPAAKKTISLFK